MGPQDVRMVFIRERDVLHNLSYLVLGNDLYYYLFYNILQRGLTLEGVSGRGMTGENGCL
jgi:hypothetical protein